MRRAKNPWVAVVLTFVILGLGQAYNGQIGKAIAAFGLGLVFAALIFAGVGIPLLPLWYLGVAVDAAMSANKLVQCPNCLKTIDRAAKVCSHCARDVPAIAA